MVHSGGSADQAVPDRDQGHTASTTQHRVGRNAASHAKRDACQVGNPFDSNAPGSASLSHQRRLQPPTVHRKLLQDNLNRLARFV